MPTPALCLSPFRTSLLTWGLRASLMPLCQGRASARERLKHNCRKWKPQPGLLEMNTWVCEAVVVSSTMQSWGYFLRPPGGSSPLRTHLLQLSLPSLSLAREGTCRWGTGFACKSPGFPPQCFTVPESCWVSPPQPQKPYFHPPTQSDKEGEKTNNLDTTEKL